jgi:signal transduction histidine kinase
MKADLILDETLQGTVEVGYTETMPQLDEGPFLHEERHLIDTIARELSFVVEQKSYLEAKQRLQQQLRHADRLATIGQLAAGVAHELNEPLSTIMGFAQLASKQEGTSEEAKRDMNKIVTAALHARDVIKELLVFAREAKPLKTAFSLNDLIRDGLFFLESRFVKAGISLQCDLDETLPDIVADRSQMLQVLTNLAVNAVQAMPNGGRLKITTLARDGQINLVVEDTGCGMSREVLKDIFHPFFTTKDVNEGTGLGLSVVHGIVASHNGLINVSSVPDKGTKFSIRLPLQSGGAESGA